MGLNRYNGTLTIALVFALTGCGDSAGNGGREKQMISGRVQSEGASQGAVVDAHEVSSDGTVVAESNTNSEGTTDAMGHYTVELDAREGTSATVVVEATLGALRRAAIVETDFAAGATVVAEPMTVETTFESDVYVRALVNGSLCEGCSSAIVLDFIGASAADAHALIPTVAAVEASADVSASAAEAFHAAIVASTDESAASVRTAVGAHADARTARAISLDAAENQAQVDAAEVDYHEAVAAAYAEAGIDLDEQSVATQAAAENASARIDATASLDLITNAALRADIEVQRATIVTQALEANAAASATSLVFLLTTGETLRASLEAAASAGAAVDVSIAAAWDVYRTMVQASMRTSLSVAEQTAFDQVALAIEMASNTLHTTLDASYSLSGDVGTWIAPLLTFSLSGDAHVTTLVTAGTSEAQASAMVSMLIAMNLAAN